MSSAYAMINTVPDKMETVLEKIEGIEGVQEAYMLYGVYDIIAEVKAGDIEDLKALVLNIRKLKYVTSTLTLLIVS
jgi:DNA-binding Lrp family transcriptional regulator